MDSSPARMEGALSGRALRWGPLTEPERASHLIPAMPSGGMEGGVCYNFVPVF